MLTGSAGLEGTSGVIARRYEVSMSLDRYVTVRKSATTDR
jgi:hypothetical protein